MKTTKAMILWIVMMSMLGISAQAEVITYDFDDGTLQGWSNHEDNNEFVLYADDWAHSPDYYITLADWCASPPLPSSRHWRPVT